MKFKIYILILVTSLVLIGCSSNVEKDKSSNDDVPLADFYSLPEREDTLVYVTFKEEVDAQDKELFAASVIGGFQVASGSANLSDYLGVKIAFKDGIQRIFFILNAVYIDFLNEKITPEQLFDSISFKEIS